MREPPWPDAARCARAEADARNAGADGSAFGLDRRNARPGDGHFEEARQAGHQSEGAGSRRSEAAPMNKPIRYPLTVFYDVSCPMCASEMHALRDLDAAGRIELVDCSAPDFSDEGLL